MEVTTEMVAAAVKQAVKDKILPANADFDTYMHVWESIRRVIVAAIEHSGEIK
jgi:hypothetical protein